MIFMSEKFSGRERDIPHMHARAPPMNVILLYNYKPLSPL